MISLRIGNIDFVEHLYIQSLLWHLKTDARSCCRVRFSSFQTSFCHLWHIWVCRIGFTANIGVRALLFWSTFRMNHDFAHQLGCNSCNFCSRFHRFRLQRILWADYSCWERWLNKRGWCHLRLLFSLGCDSLLWRHIMAHSVLTGHSFMRIGFLGVNFDFMLL